MKPQQYSILLVILVVIHGTKGISNTLRTTIVKQLSNDYSKTAFKLIKLNKEIGTTLLAAVSPQFPYNLVTLKANFCPYTPTTSNSNFSILHGNLTQITKQ